MTPFGTCKRISLASVLGMTVEDKFRINIKCLVHSKCSIDFSYLEVTEVLVKMRL